MCADLYNGNILKKTCFPSNEIDRIVGVYIKIPNLDK